MEDNATPQQRGIELALAQAKRVNRESRLLVQALARLRDGEYTTAQEAQEHHEHRSN